MLAAASVHSRDCVNPRPRSDTRCVDALLALGADRSPTDSRGRSALGVYRGAVRSKDDQLAYGQPRLPRAGTDVGVEATLRPLSGPTPADEAAVINPW